MQSSSSSSSRPAVAATIQCPVCERNFTPDTTHNVLEAHIDRCLRQSAKRVKHSEFSDEAEAASEEGDEGWEQWGETRAGEGGEWSSDDASAASASASVNELSDEVLSEEEEADLSLSSVAAGAGVVGAKRGRPVGSKAKNGSKKQPRPKKNKIGHAIVTMQDDLDGLSYTRRLEALREERELELELEREREREEGGEESGSGGGGGVEGGGDDSPSRTEQYRTDFGSCVTRSTWDRLYEHQRQGCQWLWGLYTDKGGGILADEMGLGKTAQICVHFEAIAATSRLAGGGGGGSYAPIFLAVCPATVLRHWAREFKHWAPKMRACVFHNINKHFADISALGIQGILVYNMADFATNDRLTD
jgi:hypothetical protein